MESEVKGQKGGFFDAVFGTLAASLLGSVLTGGVIAAGEGASTTSQKRDAIRAGQDF